MTKDKNSFRSQEDPENPFWTDDDFKRARRVTPEEHMAFHRAVEAKLGVKLAPRGRPPKHPGHKHRPVSIRLHPKAIAWAKAEAKRRGIGYQTVINETLLHHAA
jgi:uncharacterized protein (DUF4415 family)